MNTCEQLIQQLQRFRPIVLTHDDDKHYAAMTVVPEGEFLAYDEVIAVLKENSDAVTA